MSMLPATPTVKVQCGVNKLNPSIIDMVLKKFSHCASSSIYNCHKLERFVFWEIAIDEPYLTTFEQVKWQ